MKYSNFKPIDELSQKMNDSDLFLVFMSANEVVFTGEVNDDLYAAHRLVGSFRQAELDATGSGYLADEPVSTLGCTQKFQVCPPHSTSERECIVSGGLVDLQEPNISEQNEAYSVIPWFSNFFMDLTDIIDSLGSSALTSRNGLSGGFQGPLPDNQWQSEVEYWTNISLVSLQDVVSSSTGPGNSEILKNFWQPPGSSQQKYLCRNQKIRSSAYSNFSMLGLTIVLIVGGLIIILGYNLEYLIDLIETRVRHVHKYSQLEWAANDILQTQRMAHDELGYGPWNNCAGVSAVPVTVGDQLLAVLDIQDPSYPRLKPLSPAKGNNQVAEQVESSSTNVGSNAEIMTSSVATPDEQPQTAENDERPTSEDNHEQSGGEDATPNQDAHRSSVDRIQSAVSCDTGSSRGDEIGQPIIMVESHPESPARPTDMAALSPDMRQGPNAVNDD
ncbi:MAG: hypothetical protein Q9160_007819 [Pyrenula sp. 1 TL-2023]